MCTACEILKTESHSGGNPGEKSASGPADDRGIAAARSSEGGNVGMIPTVTIQSREPVDSNSVPVGAASLEQSIGAKDVDPHRPSLDEYEAAVQDWIDRNRPTAQR